MPKELVVIAMVPSWLSVITILKVWVDLIIEGFYSPSSRIDAGIELSVNEAQAPFTCTN